MKLYLESVNFDHIIYFDAENRKKPERGRDGPKLVTAKCCALLPSDKVNVNYIATSTFQGWR